MITQLFANLLQAQGDDRGVIAVRHHPTGTFLWNTEGHAGRHHKSITVLSWSHDGRYLASGSADTTVKVWEVSTGALLQTYTQHAAAVRALAWSPEGEKIVSSAGLEALHVWTPQLTSKTSLRHS